MTDVSLQLTVQSGGRPERKQGGDHMHSIRVVTVLISSAVRSQPAVFKKGSEHALFLHRTHITSS